MRVPIVKEFPWVVHDKLEDQVHESSVISNKKRERQLIMKVRTRKIKFIKVFIRINVF